MKTMDFMCEGDIVERDLKILLLTGSYGNGHLKVSNTLKNTFFNYGITDVIESDLYYDSHPLLTKASKYLYIKSFNYGRKIYGLLYYGGRRNKRYFDIEFMNTYGMKKLMRMVETVKPDIIVNTFPMRVVPELKRKTGIQLPIVNVITDFQAHKNWIHDYIDRYYVATEDLKQNLINAGTPDYKIKVTGIPIEEKFERSVDRNDLLESYGLDSKKPVILIATGAYGVIKDIEGIMEKLLQHDNNQILVICGKNEELKNNLLEKFSENQNVRIFGYTNKMDEMMKMATVMITKPGGITLSEALAVQVPLLLYQVVPGQELENANYFQSKDAAIIVNQPDDLVMSVLQLIGDENHRNRLIDNMKEIYCPRSAEVICEDVISLVEQKHQFNRFIG